MEDVGESFFGSSIFIFMQFNSNHLHNIILEQLDKIALKQLLSSFSWHDVDFIEGDVDADGCERLIVSVKGEEIPTDIINLKAQQTRLGKIQLHTFISDEFQKMGIATKVYIAFIHQFGGIYSGFGRVMNMDGIMSIYKKLSQEPDVEVFVINGYDGKPIGVEARLKNGQG